MIHNHSRKYFFVLISGPRAYWVDSHYSKGNNFWSSTDKCLKILFSLSKYTLEERKIFMNTN